MWTGRDPTLTACFRRMRRQAGAKQAHYAHSWSHCTPPYPFIPICMHMPHQHIKGMAKEVVAPGVARGEALVPVCTTVWVGWEGDEPLIALRQLGLRTLVEARTQAWEREQRCGFPQETPGIAAADAQQRKPCERCRAQAQAQAV